MKLKFFQKVGSLHLPEQKYFKLKADNFVMFNRWHTGATILAIRGTL